MRATCCDNSISLRALVERRVIEIAVDTEFDNVHTLTIQTATRVRRGLIAVQVYRSRAIPELHNQIRLGAAAHARYKKFVKQIDIRNVQNISPDLSPARMLRNLLQLTGITAVDRHAGQRQLEDPNADDFPINAKRDPRTGRWKVPAIRVVLVGHFLQADFPRCFGRAFYDGVLRSEPGSSDPLVLKQGKLIGFTRATEAFPRPPVVEYLRTRDRSLYAIELETRDTTLPFGPASLERHSKTFLGFGKADRLSDREKDNMLCTFREHTAKAYRYAIADVVNTLLLHEEMAKRIKDLNRSFDVDDDEERGRATLGSRVANFTLNVTCNYAKTSVALSKKSAVKALMRRGSLASMKSRYGEQTGQTHGGLSFSRTPTRLWHEAPGMLRDVDISACYPSIISALNVYWGKPIVHEPGARRLNLRRAIDMVTRLAPPDGWYIRVTGTLSQATNVLIPSTRDAVASDNYRARRQSRANKQRGAMLYSRRIESGIVTAATWQMIQAMPKRWQKEYEQLNADSVVLYLTQLIANDPVQYDKLLARHERHDLPWAAVLDAEGLKEDVAEHLDADYISLKFPIGTIAKRMADHRSAAQREHGRNSGPDTALKLQANTLYGALVCKHFPTFNAVIGNQITATARAKMLALILSLNGFQAITDGCIFRKDQVPACTFAECLKRQPDYPLRRADSSMPFLDPDSIPDSNEGLTEWVRERAKTFFKVDGPEFDTLFGTPSLALKRDADHGVSFDALACDGASNYIKCVLSRDGGRKVIDHSMRGYGPKSKTRLSTWLVDVYSTDCMTELPPVTTDLTLLSTTEAIVKARHAFKRGPKAVVLPIGFPYRKVQNFKLIRLSTFVFQTPTQRKLMARQLKNFEQSKQCGLEALALRRRYRERQTGSLAAILEDLFEYIQTGERDLTKHLHLNRPSASVKSASLARSDEIQLLKEEARDDFFASIDADRTPADHLTASIVCLPTDRFLIEPHLHAEAQTRRF
jgi:hypothetical protein